jgi:hydrogenase maturation protein HypF
MPTILAVGGHLKNTVALSVGESVFLSQHIGDMETVQARAAFERVVADFLDLYKAEPVRLACDLHPEYPSTRWAEEVSSTGFPNGVRALGVLAGIPVVPVQHHHAHLAACLAEHRVGGTALGVVWDGTGYGTDGSVWGGEFLVGGASSFERVAALRPFRLAGGDAAVREPRRAALGLLWEMRGENVLEAHDLPPVSDFSSGELAPLAGMLARGFRSPVTTSAGRLFDGVAALLGLRQRVAFEGQAAMMLEHVVESDERGAYPVSVVDWPGGEKAMDERFPERHPRWMLDWGPLLEAVLEDSRCGSGVGMISARFHNGLVEAIVEIARRSGEGRVALTGGCFQNRRLTERAVSRLREEGFEVLLHRLVPANDGGLSLGQVAVAAARLSEGLEAGAPRSVSGSE